MKTVLVVDDELVIVEVLRDLLEDEGYRVMTAHNGREALEHLAVEPVDLVLSDVMMPHLDGRGLCQAMQADPAYRAIPLVLLSAGGQNAVRDHRCPYAALVGKPFDLAVVLGLVERLIGGPDGA
jgi:CheY-like chemotaxis protein